MAESTPAPQGEVSSESTAAGASAVRRRSAKPWAWAFFALCIAFAAAQVGGLLLRDRLERRMVPLVRAPPAEPAARPGATAPVGEPAPLFGPEVCEVVVAGPGASPPVPAPPPPVELAPDVPPAAPKRAVAAPADVGERAPAPAAKLPAAAAATRVLLVDVFLSQRYLREAEAKLASLDLPHLRSEIQRSGRGYRVTAASADETQRKAARTWLDREGLLYRAAAEGLEVFVYYRDEAQQLVDGLGQAGVRALLAPVEGRRPFWRLYAGPFSPEEARRVQKFLKSEGIRTSLESRR